MRILFCNYEYPPLGGGGGVVNAQLAEALAPRHEVTVLTSQALDLPKQEIVNGVEILRVAVPGRSQTAAASMVSMLGYVPAGMWFGRSLLASREFDVINTHFAVPSGPLGHFLAKRAGIPNVLTVHGGDLYDPSKSSSPHRHLVLRMLIRRLLRRASVVVGQSRNTLQNIDTYYIPDFPSRLIPLGIERPAPPQAGREALGFSPGDKLLVTVGRLVARKAVSQLIELLTRMRDPRCKLIVIGDGPLLGDLRSQAEQSGVGERVMFTGFADDQKKVDLLNAADLYVSTSQHEGFGLVFLEGMAAGLPVVCYDFGGQSDFLEQDVTGALVSLNDQGRFLDECERLLGNDALRESMAAENRRRVESYFIDTCASRYEELFENLVGR